MTVTEVRKDPTALTMTITAEFDATVEQTWQLWADPRKLERWWGPPTWPATFVEHDLAVGSVVTYFMTGPDSERAHGWWRIGEVEPPHRLVFDDGFAHDDGRPNPDMPVSVIRVALAARNGGGTRMTVETTFPSTEAMEQLLAMGMDEGMTLAMGQCDEVLASITTA